jgi:hypothetical protein
MEHSVSIKSSFLRFLPILFLVLLVIGVVFNAATPENIAENRGKAYRKLEGVDAFSAEFLSVAFRSLLVLFFVAIIFVALRVIRGGTLFKLNPNLSCEVVVGFGIFGKPKREYFKQFNSKIEHKHFQLHFTPPLRNKRYQNLTHSSTVNPNFVVGGKKQIEAIVKKVNEQE